MQAYEVKQFSIATQLFEKEYAESRSAEEKAQIAFLAGESYTNLNDPASAAGWYFKAQEEGYGPEALEHYAITLKKQEKYQEAIHVYEDLLKVSPGSALYRSNITLCKQAIEWKNNTNPAYVIQPASFNSPAADYSAYPLGKGKVLFTSDRGTNEKSESYLWTGRSYSDLYVSDEVSNQIYPYDPVINSKENDGTAILSPDGQTLVFTRCFVDQDYNAWCKLMWSQQIGGEWSVPSLFPFIKEKVNYGHPAFAANGTTLFFSSDAIEGQGGHDIYFSQTEGENGWTEPINLGSLINTTGNEQYPTVYKDTLYFSSDQLAGLGGLDIFKTYIDAKGNWVPPMNLRPPLNSGSDDFGFVVDTFEPLKQGILMKGFFTSSRDGISHNDDIYSFTLSGLQPGIDTIVQPEADVLELKPIDYQLFISVRVMEPEFEVKNDPNSKRVGLRQLPNGPVIVTESQTDHRLVTDELGQVLIKLEWNKEYTFTARYRDHLAATYTVNTGEIERNEKNPITTINKVLELDPIFMNTEIALENIFYDYDQWAIREDARPSLDKLLMILKTNPAIRIQLSSYTDCRGTDEYNLDLSQKRAQAAIEYLIAGGINAGRLVAQGFGESSLADNCICEQCTETQHQTNRRTTFKIIN
jgi:outer membrane protein OmpA-like peptidoglycan-associated protein/tetratricopeptide (TPR) repeat protein